MQKIEDGHVVIWRCIKGGGQRPRYGLLLTKRWLNWVTPRCLLRTRPQDQHFEYGATHKERLLDFFKRSATTLEEQARAFRCSNRDGKKSKDHRVTLLIVPVFVSSVWEVEVE